MDTLIETPNAVTRLFGREPTVEDLRWVGRWQYAACWLAENRATARELARGRLALSARAATTAAMAAGRGNAERFALVSAIARLPEAVAEGTGALRAAADRAVDDEAARLVEDGAALRAATFRERAAFAPRFGLEAFGVAMQDSGQERHVLLREVSSALDESLVGVRGPCPALRVLRLFLLASLAVESFDSSLTMAPVGGEERDAVTNLGVWLTADLALAARRAASYEAAWGTAARTAADAVSKAVSGLASGSMPSKGVVEAFADEPWALPVTLAMTNEPGHASALLDCGVLAQAACRAEASREIARWATQATRVDGLESGLGITVIASREVREGFREYESAGGLDLFSAWEVSRAAEDARSSLRGAVDRSVGLETTKRREAVRQAKNALQAAREAYEASVEAAQSQGEPMAEQTIELASAEAGAQRGCAFGLGTGGSVLAAYALVALFSGTDGIVGRVAPLVVGVSALPIVAAILAHLAVSARKAAVAAEGARRRAVAKAESDRLRATAERAYEGTLAHGRESLEAAEASLAALERRLAASVAPE